MNYIAQLQSRTAEAQAEAAAYREGIAALRAYLALPKFHGANAWVNVADVLLQLQETESAALNAATLAECAA